MGQPAEKLPAPRATLADLAAVPPGKVAELIRGVLHIFNRPGPRHVRASSRLGAKLGSSFDLGDGGPGGWVILVEPEVHFPEPSAPEGVEVVHPDLAGWRVERMPELPEDEAYFTLAPDWICEVLSRSTATIDRIEKMPLYARNRVLHAWLIDPVAHTLEVYRLASEGGLWTLLAAHRGNVKVRAEPFEAIELDLALLWP
jgi:Uma2 family endonuclease